jgi:hypothetical protein
MIDRHDNSEIETAAAGSPVERADLRHRQADQALARAPEWVRRRIAEIRGDRLDDGTVERRGGVEFAHEARELAAATRSLAGAPAHIRRRVNEHRRRSGLPEVAAPRPEPTGPGVWVVDKRTGKLVPATAARTIGTTTRSPARPTPAPRATLASIVERVLILPCPAFTDAAARHVGRSLPESISPSAFGRAADLNRERSFDLQFNHHGPRLALAGESLRAIDTPHGLVVEWIVDTRMPLAGDALRAISAGCGVSVCMKVAEARTMRLPSPTTVVTRARLEHIALLTAQAPAYRAAAAMRFPGSTRGDAAELAKQIDKVVAEARFRWSRHPQ